MTHFDQPQAPASRLGVFPFDGLGLGLLTWAGVFIVITVAMACAIH
jgi:hypothetical protein